MDRRLILAAAAALLAGCIASNGLDNPLPGPGDDPFPTNPDSCALEEVHQLCISRCTVKRQGCNRDCDLRCNGTPEGVGCSHCYSDCQHKETVCRGWCDYYYCDGPMPQ